MFSLQKEGKNAQKTLQRVLIASRIISFTEKCKPILNKKYKKYKPHRAQTCMWSPAKTILVPTWAKLTGIRASASMIWARYQETLLNTSEKLPIHRHGSGVKKGEALKPSLQMNDWHREDSRPTFILMRLFLRNTRLCEAPVTHPTWHRILQGMVPKPSGNLISRAASKAQDSKFQENYQPHIKRARDKPNKK